jgi:hypothetical protein
MSKFKVGDRVRRNSKFIPCGLSKEEVNKFNGIYTVKSLYKDNGQIESMKLEEIPFYWPQDMFDLANDKQVIVIHTEDNETIATLKQGKQVIKSAKAKCNPTDEFDFGIGGKLAFERLFGENKPTYKEVKRPAKAGEWVKALIDFGPIEKNSIYKVKVRYNNGGIGVFDMKWPAPGDGYWYLYDNKQYVVLENYQPPIKEKTLADYTNQEISAELLRRFS